jgi:2-C-methyl-D-erythritol 2,4-cyclodiphosphate synthase
MRIGHGFDVHSFEEGDLLVLGGVKIPFIKKFKAHSDGDVLIHAVCDALLGAAALGDIGRHFPDTDEHFKGIDSRVLLTKVMSLIKQKNYCVGNVDVTVIAQKPHLMKFMDMMQKNLAEDLQVKPDQVNVKATTTEGLGYVGRQEGIAVHAVVLIFERETQ